MASHIHRLTVSDVRLPYTQLKKYGTSHNYIWVTASEFKSPKN